MSEMNLWIAYVIVGAPWDDNGAVYIYSGDIISNLEINIKVQEVRVKSTIRTFGFSLSNPVDIDDNGFPDIAIGAYLTGHALVLKSRPVLKTEILITSRPRTLDRNTTNFLLTICVAHFQIGKPTLESFNLKISVDETFERVNETKNSLEHISKWDDTLVTVCFDKYFYLLESNKNFVDSIEVKVTHEFNNKTILKNEGEVMCDLCPIEYKGVESITGELNIPFNIECGLDEVCTSSISLSANFTGVSEQLTWIIGSKDISLEIILKNEAEPAYLTTISIDLPHNIYLSSVLPYCNENTDGEIVKVTCDAGNPLTGTPRVIKIDLDMSQLNDGGLNGTTLEFNIKVNTRSQNNGDQHLSRSILLLSEFVFDLQGNAHDKNYYYSTEDKSSSNISFQHAYQLKKIGETPIFISGKLYKCSTRGITLMKKLVNYTPVILKEEEETYHLNVNESKSLNLKRDIDQSPEKLVPMMISNFQSQPEIMIDVNAPRIYLNCTSTDVECGKITCEIGSLNSDQDTGGLQLDFSINPVLWNYTQNTEAQVIFTTDAWIDVIKPTLEEIETASGSNLTAYISTNIYKIDSNKNKLASIWIIVGSVFLGLLAVLLFSFILYKCGFFKRSKKEELAALKDETDSMSEPSEL
ncbi:Similar to ITGA6: Integrin alpha-6 (Homo sapiens) [Cotesia congregata]|uniref:Similar to ITGA6: Integrin alpha-6 (Homo sapiens) n=1 Tax=Cotesia congregata TaxID=51543 RepID=A0A8J2MIW8_COTCN|nr:Similar to ITGA6: Integrin alpha-6 (Homo sapiens) [Cotesia congregata]